MTSGAPRPKGVKKFAFSCLVAATWKRAARAAPTSGGLEPEYSRPHVVSSGERAMMPLQQLLYVGQSARCIGNIAVGAGLRDQSELALHPLRLAGGEFGAIGGKYPHLPGLVGPQRPDDSLTLVQCVGQLLIASHSAGRICG